MARYNPLKPGFSSGEISPLLDGRSSSLEQMVTGARYIMNGVPIVEGPVVKSPGTYDLLAATGASAGFPFVVSSEAVYDVLLFDGVMKFTTSSAGTRETFGFVLDDMSAEIELASPYTAEQAPRVRSVQTGNVAYLTHPEHYPYKLVRVASNEFTLEPVVFRGGTAPIGAYDTTSNRIVANVAGGIGDRRLTFEKTLDPARFRPGRILYAKHDITLLQVSDTFGEVFWTIDQINPSNNKQLDVTIGTEVGSGGSTVGAASPARFKTDVWAFEVFSAATVDDPGRGCNGAFFFENRLVYFGFADNPDRFFASQSDDWESFALADNDPDTPDSADADKAIPGALVSKQTNIIEWGVGVERGMLFGTASEEFVVSGTDDGILTPLGTRIRATTEVGSAPALPAIVNGEVYFIERGGSALRTFTYSLEKDSFRSPDATPLAKHLGDVGFRKMAFQMVPHRILWVLREDGTFAGWAINDQQQFYAACQRQLEDAVVIDFWVTRGSQMGEQDDLVKLLVDRTVNGVTRRRLEVLAPFWRPALPYRNVTQAQKLAAIAVAPFMEAAVTFMNRTAAITATSGSTFTVANSFSVGDRVRVGASTGLPVMQGSSYLVRSATSTTVEVETLGGEDLSDALGTIIAADRLALYEEVTSLSGLDHLEGGTVAIRLDGFRREDQVVVGGEVTFPDRPAAMVRAGLLYDWDVETTRFGGKPTMGTDEGAPTAISGTTLRLYRTRGLQVGRAEGTLSDVIATPTPDDPFFTGDVSVAIEGSWDDLPTIRMFDRSPDPVAVMAVMPEVDSSDR